MRAVILAAGRGGRLRAVVGDRPKCLARIGARTIVERQIQALRGCGLDEIAVVAGYGAADVIRTCGPGIDVVHNTRYASTNSLYSFWLARDLVADGCVVLNGDVVFHPQLLSDLLTARHDDALLVEAAGASVYSDEEMKVQVRRGCVAGIDKTMASDAADGENLGIAKFGRAGAAVLVEETSRLIEEGGVNEWVPRALAAFAQRRPLHVVGTRGLPWIEIDFPEDYWRACSDVAPSIDRAGAVETLGRTRRHV